MPSGLGQNLYDSNGFTFLGDSRLAQIFYDAPTNGRTNAYHWFNWARWLSGNRFFNAGQFGISGYRSDQYLAPQYVQQAFATKAKFLVIYGITNDVNQYGANVDYWSAYIKPVAQAWINSGRVVILPTETGQNGFTSSATDIGAVTKYNRQIRQFCQEQPGAILFDMASLVNDPAYAMQLLSSMSYDGVHPNTINAGQVVGAAFAALMQPLVPSYSDLVATQGENYTNGAVQWFPNPLWTTTSGGTAITGFTGTSPAGVTGGYVNSGGSGTIGTQSGVLGNDLKVVLTSGGVGSFNVQLDLTNVGTENPGDIFHASCEATIKSGATGFQSLELDLESNRNSVSYDTSDGDTQANSNGVMTSTADVTIDLMTPPLTIQPGTRGWLTGNLNFYFNASGSATILIRRVGFWRRQAS